MKIAIDIHSLENRQWAGKERYVEGLVKELAHFDKDNQYYLYLRKNIHLNFPANFQKRTIKFPSIFWHLAVVFDLFFLRPRVYLAPTSYIVPAIKIFTPTIIIVHDLVSFVPFIKTKHQKKAKIIEKLLLKMSCKRASTIITVSIYTKKDLIDRFKIDPQKIFVLYGAIHSRFRPIDNKNKINEVLLKYKIKDNFILLVGTLEPRKNIANAILAFNGLLNDYKLSGLKLVIAGKRGWYYDEIFNKVQELNLEKNDIIFTDYIPDEDLPYLYNSAGCFIYPSLYEGFGIPVVEAMACGCPVITSNISSLPEIAGDAAILINPYNIKEISEAIYKVLTDNNKREEMRQKGLEQIKKFSWPKTARDLLLLFNNFK